MRPHSTRSISLIVFVFCVFFSPAPAHADHADGDVKRAREIIRGELVLYRQVVPGPAVPFQAGYAPDSAERTEWYLYKADTDQEILVTRYNYKSVLSLMLKDQPDLLRKLGERGYRFKDMHAIVEAYNQSSGRT